MAASFSWALRRMAERMVLAAMLRVAGFEILAHKTFSGPFAEALQLVQDRIAASRGRQSGACYAAASAAANLGLPRAAVSLISLVSRIASRLDDLFFFLPRSGYALVGRRPCASSS